MKYKKLTGIILKKQNYKEADQIITVWTKEVGKFRFLAKSSRLPKSKLAYNLQDLSVVRFEVVGKNLPVLINAETVQTHNTIRENLAKTSQAIYASELVLKLTADRDPNLKVFELIRDFFGYLDSASPNQSQEAVRLFTINLLQALGFGIKQSVESIIERKLKSETFLSMV